MGAPSYSLWVPTTPGGLTLPVLETGLCLCQMWHRTARAVKRPMCLADHSLTQVRVLSCRFGGLGGINSDVLNRLLCAFDFP
jgi:hypothetical protein